MRQHLHLTCEFVRWSPEVDRWFRARLQKLRIRRRLAASMRRFQMFSGSSEVTIELEVITGDLEIVVRKTRDYITDSIKLARDIASDPQTAYQRFTFSGMADHLMVQIEATMIYEIDKDHKSDGLPCVTIFRTGTSCFQLYRMPNEGWNAWHQDARFLGSASLEDLLASGRVVGQVDELPRYKTPDHPGATYYQVDPE